MIWTKGSAWSGSGWYIESYDLDYPGQEGLDMVVDGTGCFRIAQRPDTLFPLNQWAHIVTTFNSTTHAYSAYINGVSQTVASCNGLGILSDPLTISSTADPKYIGYKPSGNIYLNGQLDEVRIYNRVLSAGEIGDLYRSGQITMNTSQNGNSTSGLVGDWSFNGPDISGTTTYDRSPAGNHLDGTITGATVAPGKIGQALNFANNTTDNISFSDNAAWTWTPVTQDRTLSFWYYPTSIPTDAAHPFQFLISSTAPGNHFQFVHTYNNALTGVISDNAWSPLGAFSANWTATLNTWYHIVFVASSGGNNKIYINGAPQTVTDGNWTQNTSINPTVICTRDCNGSTSGSGRLDEMRWYSRALSAGEVGDLYRMVQATMRSVSGSSSSIGNLSGSNNTDSTLNNNIWYGIHVTTGSNSAGYSIASATVLAGSFAGTAHYRFAVWDSSSYTTPLCYTASTTNVLNSASTNTLASLATDCSAVTLLPSHDYVVSVNNDLSAAAYATYYSGAGVTNVVYGNQAFAATPSGFSNTSTGQYPRMYLTVTAK